MPDFLANILSLARAGAASRAWDAFVGAGLTNVADDPAVLTLKGRLLKDQARAATGQSRTKFFIASAKAYTDAAKLRPDSYPLINAAAMSLFAGQQDHMRWQAQEVLSLIQSGQGEGETPYWHEATRAEALLLLGEVEAAKAALANAVAHAAAAWEDRATTIRQFREIAAALALPVDWLTDFAPPPSLVFSGIIGIAPDDEVAQREIENAVQATGAGFAYGALAAGADILIAEALLRTGAELHVVLPAIAPVFKRQSVEPFGADWATRYDSVMERADSVTIVNGSVAISQGAIQVAALVARGMAVEKGRRMESICRSIEVTDRSDDGARSCDINVKVERSAQHTPPVAIEPSKMIMLIATVDGQLLTRLNLGAASKLHGMHIAASHDVELAASGLTRLAGSRSVRPMAATLNVADSEHSGSDTDIAQVVRIAQSTLEGSVGLSMEAAMALKALHPEIRIEPIGELPDQGRALAMYALIGNSHRPGTIAGGERLV